MHTRFFAFAAITLVSSYCLGQAPAADAPDPKEIPVPPVQTSLERLPGVDALPVRSAMPDPMVLTDGTRVTTLAQWTKRRGEIRRILEYYHTGRMPPAPGNVKGTEIKSEVLLNGKVKYRLIHLTFGPEEKLGLDVGIFTPVTGGPFPAVIQFSSPPPGATLLPRLPWGPTQGRGLDVELVVGEGDAHLPRGAGPSVTRKSGEFSGASNAEAMASRSAALAHGYGYVVFSPNDCAEDTTLRLPDGSWAFRTTRFFPAYPGYDWGIIGAWVWGAMRVIDYLQNDPLIDRQKLVITGVSRYGKAAMITGAFDERIAVVAPVASSGLGTPAYRFSGAGRGGKEGLSEMMRKYPNQFSPHLHEFWGQVDKLPYDADWFPALCAPRPFLAVEGTRDQNVVANAVKQTWLGAQPVYNFLHAPDRLGVWWSDRPHGMGANDWEGILAFADEFFLGRRSDKPFDLFPVERPE